MNFINEYALLFAVALPVVVIAAMQAYLYLAGERGTGLLPGFTSYPSIAFEKKSAEVVAMPAPNRAAVAESSNDEMERQAA